VMALILISVMDHDLIRSPGLAHVEPSPSSPSTLGTAGSRVAQDAAPDPVLAGWLTHALAGWLAPTASGWLVRFLLPLSLIPRREMWASPTWIEPETCRPAIFGPPGDQRLQEFRCEMCRPRRRWLRPVGPTPRRGTTRPGRHPTKALT
jgi:hypothetical protein